MRNHWTFSLILSAILHVAIIYQVNRSAGNIFKQNKETTRKEKTTEIKMNLKQIKKINKIKDIAFDPIKPLPYTENIMQKLIKTDNYSPLKKPDIFNKNTKKIIFSKIAHENDKIEKTPTYMNYYRLVREKIRTNTYNNYNDRASGKVILSFSVLPNGTLQNIDLHSSSSNIDLRRIAIKSLKASAPFPKFPPELAKHQFLKFNISIHFKNK